MSSSLTKVSLESALAPASRALCRTGMTRVLTAGSVAFRLRDATGLGGGAAAFFILAPISAVSLRSFALFATFSRLRASKALNFPGGIVEGFGPDIPSITTRGGKTGEEKATLANCNTC